MNKEYRNSDFNIITDNEALAIDVELSNNQNLTLATIYCPNGNPNLTLFQSINNLSDNVMFVGDFSSKLESFGCAKDNTSGPILKNIQKQLNLITFALHVRVNVLKYNSDLVCLVVTFPIFVWLSLSGFISMHLKCNSDRSFFMRRSSFSGLVFIFNTEF